MITETEKELKGQFAFAIRTLAEAGKSYEEIFSSYSQILQDGLSGKSILNYSLSLQILYVKYKIIKRYLTCFLPSTTFSSWWYIFKIVIALETYHLQRHIGLD